MVCTQPFFCLLTTPQESPRENNQGKSYTYFNNDNNHFTDGNKQHKCSTVMEGHCTAKHDTHTEVSRAASLLSSADSRLDGRQLANGSVTGLPLLPGRMASGNGRVIVEDKKLTFGDSLLLGGCVASLRRGVVFSREGRLQ